METAGRDGQICASVYRIIWTENVSKNGAFCRGAGKKKIRNPATCVSPVHEGLSSSFGNSFMFIRLKWILCALF